MNKSTEFVYYNKYIHSFDFNVPLGQEFSYIVYGDETTSQGPFIGRMPYKEPTLR
jgi:hypothetical protein